VAINVRVRTDFSKAFAKLDLAPKVIAEQTAPVYKSAILKEIQRGVSPVRGEGAFKVYSPSYKKAIRAGRAYPKTSIRPVNLTVSGQLLNSYYDRVTNGKLLIGFDDDLFDIHNRRGAGKSKVKRRMLPTESGERFNRAITQKVQRKLTSIISKLF